MKLLIGLQIDPATEVAALHDGTPYVANPWRLSFFKDADGQWREEGWPSYEPCLLVCRTPGCVAEGDEIVVRMRENVDGVFRAGCGGCGQPITEMWIEDDVAVLPLFPPDTATGDPTP